MTFDNLTKLARIQRIDGDEEYARAYATAHSPDVPLKHRLKAYKEAIHYEANQPDSSRLTHSLGGAAVGAGLGALIGAPRGNTLFGAGVGGALGAATGYLTAGEKNELIRKAKLRSKLKDSEIEHELMRHSSYDRMKRREDEEAERRYDRYHNHYRDYALIDAVSRKR